MTDTVTLTRDQAAQILLHARRGIALRNWVATTVLLGHASPGSTLEYVDVEPWSDSALIKDFVAWTSGRKHLAEGCDARLREWANAELTSPGMFDHLEATQ